MAYDPKTPLPGREYRFHRLLTRLRQDDCPSPRILAEWLDLNKKTVQRDLLHMRDILRWPIEYDQSLKGWRLKEKGFFLPLAFASKQDLQAIMILGELVAQYAETPLGGSMQAGFTRLLELFNDNETDVEKVRAFSRRVCFAGAPVARIDSAIWMPIITALQQDQRLNIEYRKRGSEAPKWREFDPYGLIVRNRDWFVHGYCHEKKRALTLLLPYIASVKLVDEFFELPNGFDLQAYSRGGFMGLQAGDKRPQKVVLRFAPEAAGAAQSAPFMPGQKMEFERSGYLRVTFETNTLFQISREVMRWGACVEVIQPKELRDDIRGAANEMVGLYGKRRV